MKRILLALALVIFHSTVAAQSSTTFVFVKVPESLQPDARASKYEDPLNAALKDVNLGEVTGGGSLLSADRKTIEWIGLDVDLANLMMGIPFLRRKLIELGAPKGSTMEYQLNGQTVTLPVY